MLRDTEQFVKDNLAKKSIEWHTLQKRLLESESRGDKDKLLLECRQLEKHMQHLIQVYNRYLALHNKKGRK